MKQYETIKMNVTSIQNDVITTSGLSLQKGGQMTEFPTVDFSKLF